MSYQIVMPNGRIVTAIDVLQMQETNMNGWRLAQARAIELDTLRRQLAEAEADIEILETCVQMQGSKLAEAEEARGKLLDLASECDGIEGVGSAVIAKRIRIIIGGENG